MDREDYLGTLYAALRQSMPEDRLGSVMSYYEEYFREAGPEREGEVIAELGPPEALARQILSTGARSSMEERRGPRPRWTAGKIVALICLSPLWISLLAAAAAALLGLVVGVGLGGLGLIGAGFFMGWCGFTALFTPGITTTMFFGGLGIVMAALGLAMLAGAVALGGVCGKGLAALCRRIFVGRRRAV